MVVIVRLQLCVNDSLPNQGLYLISQSCKDGQVHRCSYSISEIINEPRPQNARGASRTTVVMPDGGIRLLVADSNAFIKGIPLQKLSNQVTVREVVSEIRDAETRRRLQVLPYELSFKEPSQSAIRHGRLLGQHATRKNLSYIYCRLAFLLCPPSD